MTAPVEEIQLFALNINSYCCLYFLYVLLELFMIYLLNYRNQVI